MGFRFYRRVNLGSGFGLNMSKSGVGASMRGKHGSIGSRGFSIRTGIPGLSFRQNWGKGGQGALAFLLIAAVVAVILAVLVVVAKVVMVLAVLAWEGGRWCFLTAQDYLEHRRTGQQNFLESPESEASADSPARPEKTLAEILAAEERSTSSND
ncbi:DUF4236 domain-containing protein [Marilutibacter maris]|uniref:DUF4236 domain-containing protein n=1 Tax=Marilutibacter maris TaxID=1605891 RepID=UPI000DAA3614|nr:DUF4236 domain-containing protein [Lysobacter maris]